MLESSDLTMTYKGHVQIAVTFPEPGSETIWATPPTFGFTMAESAQLIIQSKALKVEIRIGTGGFTVVPLEEEEY